MDTNPLAGFTSILQNLKAQQSRWTSHVKFGPVNSFWDAVECVRGAMLTQATVSEVPLIERYFGRYGDPYENWRDISVGKRVYTSTDVTIELTQTGVFMLGKHLECYVVIGEQTEVEAICAKIESKDQ